MKKKQHTNETAQSKEEPIGLECLRCGCRHFYVVYTRPMRGGKIRRRRECRNCGKRITTIEKSS